MKNITITLFLIISLFDLHPVWASEVSHFTKKASEFAKIGQFDLAFINYQAVLRDDKLSAQALFASGEYYFLNFFPEKSKSAFQKYIKVTTTAQSRSSATQSIGGAHRKKMTKCRKIFALRCNIDGKLFALAYLLKIARLQQNQKSIKKLETDILSLKRQGFVFEEKKEYQYTSPLYRKHRVIYTIDKIAIIIEDQIFEKISF